MKKQTKAKLFNASLLFGIATLSAVAFAFYWIKNVYPYQAAMGDCRELMIELPQGISATRLSHKLQSLGIVENAFLWRSYMRLTGADTKMLAGEVKISNCMTPEQVARKVSRGVRDRNVVIMIPEGFNRFEIAERLAYYSICDETEFLAASSDPRLLVALDLHGVSSAEGYLFPDSYELRTGTPAGAVVRVMIDNWKRKSAEIFSKNNNAMLRLKNELQWSTDDVIRLASIVQKEAAKEEELAVIAGVFLNRLRFESFNPKRLQADPTIAYGCFVKPNVPSCLRFDGKHVGRTQRIDGNNPYNTYYLEGLPPGPISNPGIAAVQAVLKPAQHRYLYFVAKGDGSHHFSVTLKQHQRAIERYLR